MIHSARCVGRHLARWCLSDSMRSYLLSFYDITIAAQDEPEAKTTIRVEVDDTTGAAVRITEMVVRAVEGGNLTGAPLHTMDFGLLLRAIGAAAGDETSGPGAGEAHPVRKTATRAARPAPERRAGTRSMGAGRRGGAGRKGASTAKIREYRRMPDDLERTYAALGSITAVAEHYDVPRHTAQGWMNRLRRASRT